MNVYAQEFARRSPFPYFGGKRKVAPMVWEAFGDVAQYIEPFCGSAAMLLACPRPASLEVIGDASRHIANFWRAVKFQPEAVARWADYPVSHLDLAARHRWLTCPQRVAQLDAALADPEWHGDAHMAGWWVWGQCAWIGSGWCEKTVGGTGTASQIPHLGDAGQGIQSKIPHLSDAGQGIQSKIPHVSNAGRGIHSQIPHVGNAGRGQHIARWMQALAARLEDVRIIHGSWDRCLNMHYGDKGRSAAVFLDPPYLAYEHLYAHAQPVAQAVAEWAAAHPEVKIAVCGHVGDYDATLRGWRAVPWSRGRLTYGGKNTTDSEVIYFSPACNVSRPAQQHTLF